MNESLIPGRSSDVENEFQFQLQGYSSPAKPVNPATHNRL
jgi:hypothetical protein